ncbi:hypothetical protein B0T14DRAFT_511917 [Immersiella caudata]|uniref:RING-type domain-containing protein n=1 Tax=Immersiella caudata TaxID=314043 RepID=A0AA39X4H8_9PEZI|nr:hypothetical protein B0T14DRAFT_511917 [Immersiella caudata]
MRDEGIDFNNREVYDSGIPDNSAWPASREPTAESTGEPVTTRSSAQPALFSDTSSSSTPQTVLSARTKGKERADEHLAQLGQPPTRASASQSTQANASGQHDALAQLLEELEQNPDRAVELARVLAGSMPGPQPPAPPTSQPGSPISHAESAEYGVDDPDYYYGTEGDEPVESIPATARVGASDGFTYFFGEDPEVKGNATRFRIEGRAPISGRMVISAPSRNKNPRYSTMRREYLVMCSIAQLKWSDLTKIPIGTREDIKGTPITALKVLAVATDPNISRSQPQHYPLTYVKIRLPNNCEVYFSKGSIKNKWADMETDVLNRVRQRVGQFVPVAPDSREIREAKQEAGEKYLRSRRETPEEFRDRQHTARGGTRTPAPLQLSRLNEALRSAPEGYELTAYGHMPTKWLISRNNLEIGQSRKCMAQDCQVPLSGHKGDVQLACGHAFHEGCINLGLTSQGVLSCPWCGRRYSFFYTFYSIRYPLILVDFNKRQNNGYPRPGQTLTNQFLRAINDDYTLEDCYICKAELFDLNRACVVVHSCSVPHTIVHASCLAGETECPLCRTDITSVFTQGRIVRKTNFMYRNNRVIRYNPDGPDIEGLQQDVDEEEEE